MDSTIKMVKRHLKKHGGRVHYGLGSKAAGIRPALLEIALAEFRATHPVSTFPTADGGELAASYEGDSSGFSIVTSTYRHIESGHVVTDKRHLLSASVRYGGALTLRLDDTEASIVEFFASLVEAMRQRFPKAKLTDAIEANRVDLGGGVHGGSIRRAAQTVTPTGDAPSDDAGKEVQAAAQTGDAPSEHTQRAGIGNVLGLAGQKLAVANNLASGNTRPDAAKQLALSLHTVNQYAEEIIQ